VGDPDASRSLRPRPWSGVLRSPFARALLALTVIVLLGATFNGDGAFFKWGTHRDMLRQASVFGILACGMTVVIISAGIDLSVGSVLGLSAVMFSILTIHWGWTPWAAIPLCLLLGAACGAVSGSSLPGAAFSRSSLPSR